MGMSDLRDQLQATLGDAYRIERELPGGGMSRVFLAEEARFGRHVVVKLLPPDLAGGVSTERFRREIELLGKMYHPRIVPILAMGEQGNFLYYTMPFVAGESLRDRLDREKQLPVEDAVRIAREIAEALGHAHRLGIIHRDVKPGNVLLAGESAVVTDFGIARAVERSAQGLSVTSSGFTLGTPTYMSPEQASGHHDLDARSDLYALGCVLYEMLAGEPPFTGANPQAVIARHMSDTPRSIRLVRREVPEQVERVVMRLLAKNPADRYPTAERVAEVLGHPDRISVLTRRFIPDTPRRAARAGIIGAGLVIAGAAALLSWTRARDGRAGALGALGAAQMGRGAPESDAADPTHLAVLYFDAPAGDTRLAAIAGGITRDLIYSLSHVPGLTLTSSRGVLGLRALGGTDAAHDAARVDSVLRALRVGTVVDGGIEPVGDSLRVEVHVADARTMVEKDVSRVTIPRAHLLTLRDTVVRLVAQRLRRTLGDEVQLRAWRAETRSDSAWRLRQEAEQLLEDERLMPQAAESRAPALALLARSDSLLTRASALDPAWAEPVVARGTLALEAAERRKGDAGAMRAATDRARALASSVLARRPADARAQELMGLAWYNVALRVGAFSTLSAWDSAVAHLRAAVASDPSLASAWNSLSLALQTRGDHAGAVEALQRAINADAYLRSDARTTTRMVFTLLFAGQADSARATCARARPRFAPTAPIAGCDLAILGWTGHGTRDVAEARDALRRVENDGAWPMVGGISPEGRFYLAAVLARSGGAAAESARVMARATRALLVQAGAPDAATINEAAVQVLLGNREAALAILERTARGNPGAAAQIAALPWFSALRGDPRFRRLTGP